MSDELDVDMVRNTERDREREESERRGHQLDLWSLIGCVAICPGRLNANKLSSDWAKRIICRSLCTFC